MRGPDSGLVFLGTGVDTDLMRVFVPPERAVYTINLLHNWLHKSLACHLRFSLKMLDSLSCKQALV